MSHFETLITTIKSVESHPNADRLSINKIGDYVAISNKLEDGSDRYKPGQSVIYVPCDAVIPDNVLKLFGYWDHENNKGLLSGYKGNRVSPRKLRGVFSEGLIFPIRDNFELILPEDHPVQLIYSYNGANVADIYGIKKYEVIPPAHLSGQVTNIGRSNTFSFDVENSKKYTDVFENGEEVTVTSKIHGTNIQILYLQQEFDEIYEGHFCCGSKGLGATGLFFKHNEENLNNNAYLKTVMRLEIFDNMKSVFQKEISEGYDIQIYGELYGYGIQDLNYNTKVPTIAGITIWLRKNGKKTIISPSKRKDIFNRLGFDMVPIHYQGPYSEELLTKYLDMKDPIGNTHIQEGIVIEAESGYDPRIGVKCVKRVSEQYLLRKNKDATEYQ